jgi:hypothetical protein
MALSNLTAEQQENFHRKLKEFRMDPSKVVPAITPATHPGPVTLTADTSESTIAPHMITLTSVDELKRLAGNSDDEFESGRMEEHHDVQPEWPDSKNDLSPDELTAAENNQIEAAHIAYVFGHSKRHESYKKIIEKHKYPAQFAVFAAETVCIDSTNSPYKISSESGHVYGTVTICEGGVLEFDANVTVSIQKLVRSEATSCSAV